MKTRTFPDTPLVVVRWVDANSEMDDEVDPADPGALLRFGRTLVTEEPVYLTCIDSQGVKGGLTKWPEIGKVGRSNTVPLKMVELVRGVDGTVYYECRRRKLSAKRGGA